VEALLFVQIN